MTEPNQLGADAAHQPITRAVLDAGGALLGFTQDQGTTGPEVPHDCDLQPGKYVWDGSAFQPVLSAFSPDGPAPDWCKAIIKALCLTRDGLPLTPDVAGFLAGEEASYKSQGRW